MTAGYEDYDHVAGGASFASSKKQVAGANGLVSSPVMSSNYGASIPQISDGTSNTALVGELRAGLSPIDPRGVWAMGFPGASIVNGGRGAYNPSPNNMLGGTAADGGDELQDGSLYCSPQAASVGMGCTTSGTLMTSAMSGACTGGVNVFADGSVRFIKNSITELDWCRLRPNRTGKSSATTNRRPRMSRVLTGTLAVHLAHRRRVQQRRLTQHRAACSRVASRSFPGRS